MRLIKNLRIKIICKAGSGSIHMVANAFGKTHRTNIAHDTVTLVTLDTLKQTYWKI